MAPGDRERTFRHGLHPHSTAQAACLPADSLCSWSSWALQTVPALRAGAGMATDGDLPHRARPPTRKTPELLCPGPARWPDGGGRHSSILGSDPDADRAGHSGTAPEGRLCPDLPGNQTGGLLMPDYILIGAKLPGGDPAGEWPGGPQVSGDHPAWPRWWPRPYGVRCYNTCSPALSFMAEKKNQLRGRRPGAHVIFSGYEESPSAT